MHRIGFLLSDGFQLMTLASQCVFECANIVVGDPHYKVDNFSIEGGEVRSSLGVIVGTRSVRGCREVQTWMVTGGTNPLALPATTRELAFLRKEAERARRIAGICTGGFALANAGLLTHRRATTHWAFAREMRKRFPDVLVEEDRIYVVDDFIWTSAGMTAGLDMALAMIERDLGADVARSVARKLVMHQRRSGGQSQHSQMLDLAPKSDRIQNVLNYARSNLGRPLTIEELAERAHLSPRQFSRVFTQETGRSPAKAIEGLRLEAARLMIEQSLHPLNVIAKETGFNDRRHMREAFLRGFGVPPQAVRRNSSGPEPVSA
ncbi:GlxA family transcriptional regulator [Paraburkholderia sp. UYCP14C]|uniref:GlxA family transcriptional regulator n=1 Tax=Paraburkholderia sp. UYCP14C TaxID=2511130 RepID=UPI00101EA7E0|nr:GlxA family transcriptional regulator [Paraburkholderia sp. UYCP14C]RZF26740.1 GlxA family transcriptional regulator [Paraburkholderia sp. UYCP14C]